MPICSDNAATTAADNNGDDNNFMNGWKRHTDIGYKNVKNKRMEKYIWGK